MRPPSTIADAASDPFAYIRALEQILVELLAMHMTPAACAKASAIVRALADHQDRLAASGVAVHPSNRAHDPTVLRLLSVLYEEARLTGLEKLNALGVKPGHEHDHHDGAATPPA